MDSESHSIYINLLRENLHNFHREHWENLSANPEAIELLEENIDKIDWYYILKNPAALHLIKGNEDKIQNIETFFENSNPEIVEYMYEIFGHTIDWKRTTSIYKLIQNPAAINIIEANIQDINPRVLCINSAAIHIIKQYDKSLLSNLSLCGNYEALDFIEKNNLSNMFLTLCSNVNPKAMEIVKTNISKIKGIMWEILCANPAAIDIIKENINNIPDSLQIWRELCENPEAIEIIEQNPDKINWRSLSKNPKALHILEQNKDKIVLLYLCNNYYRNDHKYYYRHFVNNSEYVLK